MSRTGNEQANARITYARLLAAAATTAIVTACGTDTGSSRTGPEVVTETIGDTTIVRTLSGSVWGAEATLVPEVSIGELDGPAEYLLGRVGSIAVDDDRNVFVFDDQAQHVRVYDSAGVYVETLGRKGEGPGEFNRAEFIAVLPDGRLVVRDPGNTRIQVFGPGPGETEEWVYNAGNTYSGTPLYTDARGRTFLSARDVSRPDDFVMQILVLGPDGTHVDTLPEPSSELRRPSLRAEAGSGGSMRMMSMSVPFTPGFIWAVHPNGHFLTGASSDYRIDLARDPGVLRIERTVDPVPVSAAERTHHRERAERSLRRYQSDWSWSGPPIPDYKPFFTELLAGRDGRIWVRLSAEGRKIENENHDPENPRSEPATWVEPTRYDVFEPDGTYLGTVASPDDFYPDLRPVFDGNHVWAVTRDDLGVERVVRYRIEVGGS